LVSRLQRPLHDKPVVSGEPTVIDRLRMYREELRLARQKKTEEDLVVESVNEEVQELTPFNDWVQKTECVNPFTEPVVKKDEIVEDVVADEFKLDIKEGESFFDNSVISLVKRMGSELNPDVLYSFFREVEIEVCPHAIRVKRNGQFSYFQWAAKVFKETVPPDKCVLDSDMVAVINKRELVNLRFLLSYKYTTMRSDLSHAFEWIRKHLNSKVFRETRAEYDQALLKKLKLLEKCDVGPDDEQSCYVLMDRVHSTYGFVAYVKENSLDMSWDPGPEEGADLLASKSLYVYIAMGALSRSDGMVINMIKKQPAGVLPLMWGPECETMRMDPVNLWTIAVSCGRGPLSAISNQQFIMDRSDTVLKLEQLECRLEKSSVLIVRMRWDPRPHYWRALLEFFRRLKCWQIDILPDSSYLDPLIIVKFTKGAQIGNPYDALMRILSYKMMVVKAIIDEDERFHYWIGKKFKKRDFGAEWGNQKKPP